MEKFLSYSLEENNIPTLRGLYNSANMTDIHKIPFDYCLGASAKKWPQSVTWWSKN